MEEESKQMVYFKLGLLMLPMILTIMLLFAVINQDCEKNPPMAESCSSNNIIDSGLNDCIRLEYKDIGFLGWGSHNEIYSCEKNGQRIEIEKFETGCTNSPSNLTADYKFCRVFN